MIQLGDEVEDLTTGVRGIVTSRAECLNGCARLTVQPPFNAKEKKLPDSYWADEPACRVVKSGETLRAEIAKNRKRAQIDQPHRPTNGPPTERVARERAPR